MKGDEFKHDPTAEEWVDPYPKKKRHWLRWVALPIILFAIYILSYGPAFRLHWNQKIPSNIFVIYQPVKGLSEASPMFNDFLLWYVGLWMPPDFFTHP